MNKRISKLREKKIVLGHLLRITKNQEYYKLSQSLREISACTDDLHKHIQDYCMQFFTEKRKQSIEQRQKEKEKREEIHKLPILRTKKRNRLSPSPLNKDMLSPNNNYYLTISPKVEHPKIDVKEQQKKTIQMLQNYSKETVGTGGILVQDS